jgi:hypothetical protein
MGDRDRLANLPRRFVTATSTPSAEAAQAARAAAQTTAGPPRASAFDASRDSTRATGAMATVLAHPQRRERGRRRNPRDDEDGARPRGTRTPSHSPETRAAQRRQRWHRRPRRSRRMDSLESHGLGLRKSQQPAEHSRQCANVLETGLSTCAPAALRRAAFRLRSSEELSLKRPACP